MTQETTAKNRTRALWQTLKLLIQPKRMESLLDLERLSKLPLTLGIEETEDGPAITIDGDMLTPVHIKGNVKPIQTTLHGAWRVDGTMFMGDPNIDWSLREWNAEQQAEIDFGNIPAMCGCIYSPTGSIVYMCDRHGDEYMKDSAACNKEEAWNWLVRSWRGEGLELEDVW